MAHALMEEWEEYQSTQLWPTTCCTQLRLPYTYWTRGRAGYTGRMKIGEGDSICVATGKPFSLLGKVFPGEVFLWGEPTPW